MAIKLTDAFALNGTPDLTNFKSLQNQCKNTEFFSEDKPINFLSSWEGFYIQQYYILINKDKDVIPASGGTITVNYTIMNSDGPLSNVIPIISTEIGTISNINKTNESGIGSFELIIDSLVNNISEEKSYEITLLYEDSIVHTTFIQEENIVTDPEFYLTTTLPNEGVFDSDVTSQSDYISLNVNADFGIYSSGVARSGSTRIDSVKCDVDWITWDSSDPFMIYISDNSGSNRSTSVEIEYSILPDNCERYYKTDIITVTQAGVE